MRWSRFVVVGVAGFLAVGCNTGDSDTSPFDSPMTSATGTTATADTTAGPTSTSPGTGSGSSSSAGSSEGVDEDTGFKFDLANPDGSETNGVTMGCDKVDILFVIDDSGSMSDNQDKLTAAFPGMAQTIDDTLVDQQGIDYRIGVVSSNITDETMCLFGALCGPGYLGRLQHDQGRVPCSDVPTGRWIEGSEGAAAVGNQFTCIASLVQAQDFNGSEAPLEATRMALIDRVTDVEHYNLGFLRDDALLVLVLVTDEDDQSVWMSPTNWPLFGGPGMIAPVSQFHDMLVGLKGGHPENLVAVAISGPQGGGGETDAPRIHAFLDLVAPNSYWADISGSDYSTPLQEALGIIEGSCENFIPPAG
ncbi:vWA domain-containing protein [Paraliomyxa miuraensis]|uniref:hypothetical protein n=1 Tax=Paraliomyxa miuraensis TaxID=376150 RepID=UPI002255881C|nr:hypothetical protein [Paraliomyxa miuraensis]MCX4242960.1 hypothetical protein [Paraliomyxa miuraensis]